MGVGVEGDDDVAACLFEPAIERGGLAAIGDGDEPDPGIGAEMRAHQVRGAVRRSVVDHDDFNVAIVAGQNVVDRPNDDLGLVMGGYHHGLQRRRIRQCRRDLVRLGAAIAPADDTQEQDARYAEPDRRQEQPVEEMAEQLSVMNTGTPTKRPRELGGTVGMACSGVSPASCDTGTSL